MVSFQFVRPFPCLLYLPLLSLSLRKVQLVVKLWLQCVVVQHSANHTTYYNFLIADFKLSESIKSFASYDLFSLLNQFNEVKYILCIMSGSDMDQNHNSSSKNVLKYSSNLLLIKFRHLVLATVRWTVIIQAVFCD